jgi:hypothetical protein
MDLQMSIMDGYEMYTAIQENDNGGLILQKFIFGNDQCDGSHQSSSSGIGDEPLYDQTRRQRAIIGRYIDL